MKDCHIHFEKQPYTIDTVDNMVKTAESRGIDEIWLLDHTHKFREFESIYTPCRMHQETWDSFTRKRRISIEEYLCFLSKIQKRKYPLTIRFGLEVCYFPETEDILRKELQNYHFDFLIGSIHHINGMAYDIEESYWDGVDVDSMYRKYYQNTESLIRSKLFTMLGHPDAIKRFSRYPSFDLTETYERIAGLLAEYQLATENNTGFVRYHFEKLGMNDLLYAILKAKQVTINKSSDAHEYIYIGYAFDTIRD